MRIGCFYVMIHMIEASLTVPFLNPNWQATRIKALLDSIEQVSLGLEQWSKGRSADDPNIDALEDALMMLTRYVFIHVHRLSDRIMAWNAHTLLY